MTVSQRAQIGTRPPAAPHVPSTAPSAVTPTAPSAVTPTAPSAVTPTVTPAAQSAAVRRGPAVLSFPARATVLADIRRHLAERAAVAGIDGADSTTIVLAVHEAAANAVEHSGGTTVDISWEHHDDQVLVVVADDGVFHPERASADDRGRGFHILFALADTVSVRPGRPGRPGTVVRLRFHVRAAS